MSEENPTRNRPPLGWAASRRSPDVSLLMHKAKTLTGALVAIDGQRRTDSIPDGLLCETAVTISETLSSIDEILDSGDLYAEGGVS